MWRANANSFQLEEILTANPNAGLVMGWQELSILMRLGCKQKPC